MINCVMFLLLLSSGFDDSLYWYSPCLEVRVIDNDVPSESYLSIIEDFKVYDFNLTKEDKIYWMNYSSNRKNYKEKVRS